MNITVKTLIVGASFIVNRLSEKAVNRVLGLRFTIYDLIQSTKLCLRLTKVSLILVVSLVFSMFCSLITPVYAAAPEIGIRQPSTNAGPQIGNTSATELLTRTIGNAIGLIFTFAAIAAVAYFFWGVIDWIFAHGEKEGIAKARSKITHSMVGLIILSLSFVIFAVVGKITGINLTGDMVLPSFMNP